MDQLQDYFYTTERKKIFLVKDTKTCYKLYFLWILEHLVKDADLTASAPGKRNPSI